ncbi:EthD domain-containing protein [Aspergillus avenaceus]|uniref:EthD domain-containing protein n=1 Tax=Aspergillus avenaceus TaxID=36643 RepID=A0A5N6TLF3_ASPAV|nr:EthD domain-containing protein [Aspergillus avenaceus]
MNLLTTLFTFFLFLSANALQATPLTMLTIKGYILPNLTESEYHHHLTTHHVPLVKPFLRKYNILRYTLTHQTQAMKEARKRLRLPPGTEDYDVMVQFLMRDVEDFNRLWEDEEFVRTVKPDQGRLLDEERNVYTIGVYETFMDDVDVGGEMVVQ